MIQGELFNEGERDEGKVFSVKNRFNAFYVAKREAIILGAASEITADDVQDRMEELGYVPGDLGNAAGSVFSGGRWERVGYTKSRRASRHAGVIGVWRLKSAYGL